MDLVFRFAEPYEEVLDDSDFLLEFVNTKTVNTTSEVDTKIVYSIRIFEIIFPLNTEFSEFSKQTLLQTKQK
jgi:hypothetical protein